MEVNVGMIEVMDYYIGCFIEYLKKIGEYDNIIFVVILDNGLEYNCGDDDFRLQFWMLLNGYYFGIERIGEQGSWGFIGFEWVNVVVVFSDLFKMYVFEGGL